MNIILLTVGRTDVKWVAEGLELYASRLRHYAPFTVCEIPQLKNVGAFSPAQIKQKEGVLILSKVKPADEVILTPKADYTKRLISDVPKIHEVWDLSTVE